MPGLNFFGLLLLSVLVLIAALPNRLAGPGRLVWRSRWLFLILLLGYAYGLPGGAALPALGGFSPSREGLAAGGLQALRLALLLFLLERLVLGLAEERLLAGLHAFFAALAGIGIDAERLTVRLALTLRLMSDRRGGGRADLANLLVTAGEPLPDSPSRMALPYLPWRAIDSATVALAVAMVILVWLSA